MVKKQNNEDMKMEKNTRAALSNWKQFNSYERVDQQKVAKEKIANEIGNIQTTLAMARASEKNNTPTRRSLLATAPGIGWR